MATTRRCGWNAAVYCNYTASQKTFHLWLAIVFTYTVRLQHFCQKCCRESRQSKHTFIPPFLTNASALRGETGNPEIMSFYLNAACFWPKNTKHSYILCETQSNWMKVWFSRFPVLPCSAEAQVTWGGIVKCLLIAYFIGNISAQKYQNLFMCVKVIASQRWDVFWDTV